MRLNVPHVLPTQLPCTACTAGDDDLRVLTDYGWDSLLETELDTGTTLMLGEHNFFLRP